MRDDDGKQGGGGSILAVSTFSLYETRVVNQHVHLFVDQTFEQNTCRLKNQHDETLRSHAAAVTLSSFVRHLL